MAFDKCPHSLLKGGGFLLLFPFTFASHKPLCICQASPKVVLLLITGCSRIIVLFSNPLKAVPRLNTAAKHLQSSLNDQ